MRHYLLNIPDAAPDSEFSVPFCQGMLDRMLMSFHKYGPVANAYPHKVNAIQSLFVRLIGYLGIEEFQRHIFAAIASMPRTVIENQPHRRDNGNTEYLMDVGNFAMIEFMFPKHPDAHYTPTDSDASLGRVWNDGLLTDRSHRQAPIYKRDGD